MGTGSNGVHSVICRWTGVKPHSTRSTYKDDDGIVLCISGRGMIIFSACILNRNPSIKILAIYIPPADSKIQCWTHLNKRWRAIAASNLSRECVRPNCFISRQSGLVAWHNAFIIKDSASDSNSSLVLMYAVDRVTLLRSYAWQSC